MRRLTIQFNNKLTNNNLSNVWLLVYFVSVINSFVNKASVFLKKVLLSNRFNNISKWNGDLLTPKYWIWKNNELILNGCSHF